MGLMGRIFGAGTAVREAGEAIGGVAEVFVGNRAERDAADRASFDAVVAQHGGEFVGSGGRFDGFVDGLNRLPRPMLAIGTLGLFVYAMAEPAGFSVRMQGLAHVPEPLWWLLGAIVSFYFGARELHYRRGSAIVAAPSVERSRASRTGDQAPAGPAAPAAPPPPVRPAQAPAARTEAAPTGAVAPVAADDNAAVDEWRRRGA